MSSHYQKVTITIKDNEILKDINLKEVEHISINSNKSDRDKYSILRDSDIGLVILEDREEAYDLINENTPLFIFNQLSGKWEK